MFEEEEKKKVQKGGSQFADVSQYLSANQDQAKRLASTVGNQAVTAGNQARQALDATKSTFNQQVNANTVPYNQALAQRAQQDPRSFFHGYQAIPQAPANAQEWKAQRQQERELEKQKRREGTQDNFGNIKHYLRSQQGGQPTNTEPVQAPNQTITGAVPQDITDFEKMRDASYQGPNNLSEIQGFEDAAAKEQSATDITQNLGSVTGRQDVLGGLYEGSSAGSVLDDLLLGGGAAQGILGGATAQNADLGGMTENAQAASIDQANTARQTTTDTAAKIQEGLTGGFKSLQDEKTALSQKRGGAPWIKQQRQMQQMDLDQRLDALNRLMGVR